MPSEHAWVGSDVVLSLVTAIVKPHKLMEVREALEEIGIRGVTISEVTGFGRQGGHTETYRGAEYSIDFVPKVKVEVLALTTDAEKIADVVAIASRSGRIGDGKIWVTPVVEAIRIRTGERGGDSV
jgi:nitrogen regulatory protein P-II 1